MSQLLYLNQLAPWEEKSQYHDIVKLGSDVGKQTQILKDATKAQLKAQITSTNAIIASQEKISNILNTGFEELSLGLSEISEGIYGLKASFEWGISEVVWQIEQNRKELKSILDVLMAPLDTQAKELKRRADEAYANGWHEDALDDYLNSEQKNRYDFSVHISIGMIYLFYVKNKEKALEYFDKAIKYAKPKSPYYTSYALLYKALILFDLGRVEEAKNCCKESIESTDPKGQIIESFYQYAQYCAQLNNKEESLSSLEIALKNDIRYFFKADKDPLFEPIKNDVNELFNKLRLEQNEKSLNEINKLKIRIEKVDKLIKKLSNDKTITQHDLSFLFKDIFIKIQGLQSEIKNDYEKIISNYNNNSYLDYLELNTTEIPKLNRKIDWLKKEINNFFNSILYKYKQLIDDKNNSYNEQYNEYKSNKSNATTSILKYAKYYFLYILPVLGAILVAILEKGWDKLLSLLLLIPILSHVCIIIYFFYGSPLIFKLVIFCAILIPFVIYIIFLMKSSTKFQNKGNELSKGKNNLESTKNNLESAMNPYNELIKSL